ncbi:MAG: hypothetical protein K2K27_09710 [Muribaculaceae bacterium]|nr:hypothetical protein [Muribaculaceae bacterium]MDE7092911.1 hypothetical protein [Muribaculaceae bacterium]
MTDFNELIQNLLTQTGALDMAISEFKRMIADDPELKAEYKEWCEQMGYSERTGFSEYAEELIQSQEEKWDSLTDYDA